MELRKVRFLVAAFLMLLNAVIGREASRRPQAIPHAFVPVPNLFMRRFMFIFPMPPLMPFMAFCIA
jgi:hypothetical protein